MQLGRVIGNTSMLTGIAGPGSAASVVVHMPGAAPSVWISSQKISSVVSSYR